MPRFLRVAMMWVCMAWPCCVAAVIATLAEETHGSPAAETGIAVLSFVLGITAEYFWFDYCKRKGIDDQLAGFWRLKD